MTVGQSDLQSSSPSSLVFFFFFFFSTRCPFVGSFICFGSGAVLARWSVSDPSVCVPRVFQGVQDSGQQAAQQPEKAGWIRKFCGRGIFRELWRNRYVVLRGDRLYISDKEVGTLMYNIHIIYIVFGPRRFCWTNTEILKVMKPGRRTD